MTISPNDYEKILELIDSAKAARLRNLLQKVAENQTLSSSEMRELRELEAEYLRKKTEREALTTPIPQEFDNLLQVTEYLKEKGWKVAKSTIYNHRKEGKLKATPAGKFTVKSVLDYAQDHLDRVETKLRISAEEQQRKEKALQIRKIEEEVIALIRKNEKEAGRLISREDADQGHAARAAVLDEDLSYRFQTCAVDMVEKFGIDPGYISDLINYLMNIKNEVLNNYATAMEYEVILQETHEPPLRHSGDPLLRHSRESGNPESENNGNE